MKTMVISGINLFEGGPLSVFYDCLNCLVEEKAYEKNHIVLFVHKKLLFEKYNEFFEIVELPKSRKSYLYRLYYEYYYFYKYSCNHEIDIWLSLHDITPRVKVRHLFVYCHNPSPFLKKDITQIRYSIKNVAFTYFYKYLYSINIRKASAVIVQHSWMRSEFIKAYGIRNIIVARPNVKIDYQNSASKIDSKTHFIYPAFPRYFKNFEIICEACKILNREDYDVWLTIDGSENLYSKDVYERYKNIENIIWFGLLDRKSVFELYNKSTSLIFPSKMESWGLPISEYRLTEKDIILVDLPYAYETIGTYGKVMFFDQDDATGLAMHMKSVIEKTQEYQPQIEAIPDKPYAKNWNELMKQLMSEV